MTFIGLASAAGVTLEILKQTRIIKDLPGLELLLQVLLR